MGAFKRGRLKRELLINFVGIPLALAAGFWITWLVIQALSPTVISLTGTP
ncbi:hypothetical protein GCM10022248_67340 [Nonomuraea soli]